jgi:cysteine desulfurase family protein (TIGR01976 family)
MTASPPTAAGPADIAALRARFPALDRQVAGRPVVYFDGPGGTQVPDVVADAARDYLLHHNGNSGWNYPTSRETGAIVDAGRAAMADFLGAEPDEVAFGASMTTLTLRLSRALGRSLEPGDRVVVTELDHHANVDPWKALQWERGAEIRVVRMDPRSGRLDLDDLADAVRGARILAIGAASNAIGTITDVAAAAGLARDQGATVFVDAVHYAPHALVDVHALGADFLAVSPYKFYGPHSGVLWGRRERIEALALPRVEASPDRAPERLETGTPSFEAIAGITAAVDFLASLGGSPPAGATPAAPDAPEAGPSGRRPRLRAAYDALHERGDALFRRLWEGMNAIDGVTTWGPPPGEPRTPTLGFAIDGMDPAAAADALAERGLFVTDGDFYASTVIERLGRADRGGILRAGCAAYTTAEEVERLVAATAELAG